MSLGAFISILIDEANKFIKKRFSKNLMIEYDQSGSKYLALLTVRFFQSSKIDVARTSINSIELFKERRRFKY